MRYFVLFLYFFIATANTLFAQSVDSTLFFQGVDDVTNASGIILDGENSTQVTATWNYDKERGGTLVKVSVPSNTVFTGAVESASNGLIFSPVTYAELSDPRTLVSLCTPESVSINIAQTQAQTLQSLAEVRERRVSLAQKKLKTIHTPELIDRLKKLESNFGFTYKNELSINLEPEELSKRLDELYHAILRYKHYRAQ